MICRNCGNECGDAKFCSNCGTDLSVQRQEQYNSAPNGGYWENLNGSTNQNSADNGQYKQNYYSNEGSYDAKSTQNPYGQGYWQNQGNQGYWQNQGNQPPYGQNPNYRPPYMHPVVPGRGMAITSLVLGILSIVLLEMSLVLGILAIVFGAIARGQGHRGAMSVAGISCGIVGLVIYACAILLVLYGFMLI